MITRRKGRWLAVRWATLCFVSFGWLHACVSAAHADLTYVYVGNPMFSSQGVNGGNITASVTYNNQTPQHIVTSFSMSGGGLSFTKGTCGGNGAFIGFVQGRITEWQLECDVIDDAQMELCSYALPPNYSDYATSTSLCTPSCENVGDPGAWIGLAIAKGCNKPLDGFSNA